MPGCSALTLERCQLPVDSLSVLEPVIDEVTVRGATGKRLDTQNARSGE
jgi:hypothetical protein